MHCMEICKGGTGKASAGEIEPWKPYKAPNYVASTPERGNATVLGLNREMVRKIALSREPVPLTVRWICNHHIKATGVGDRGKGLIHSHNRLLQLSVVSRTRYFGHIMFEMIFSHILDGVEQVPFRFQHCLA